MQEPEAKSAKSRSRLIAGCQACRARHVKCDTASPSCGPCETLGIQCIKAVNVRFRYGLDANKEPVCPFPQNQRWPNVSAARIRYYDETPALLRYYEDDPGEDIFRHDAGDYLVNLAHESILPTSMASDIATGAETLLEHNSSSKIRGTALGSGGSFQFANKTPPGSEILGLSSTGQLQDPKAPLTNSVRTYESPTSHGSLEEVGNLFVAESHQVIPLSDREALLLRNFIENMALWADITDIERHFEIEVPRRALRQLVLRYAIFAFSSRHLNRDREDHPEPHHYHNECLKILIPAISGPPEGITEEILAAIALLRMFEEYDAHDHQFHLSGTTQILNSISTFSCSGGLGEAAAWLCLRQDIYVSLVSQQPLRTNLENFLHSDTFRRTDDLAWANRMVFLLAKVLSRAFAEARTPSSTDDADLSSAREEVEKWRAQKPATFDPIRFIPRGQEKQNRFPDIWMLSPFHVIGLQYYHIAKIVLAVSNRQVPASTYENLRRGRQIERTVRNHLLVIVGLAKSNVKAENTLFTARHSLSVWGGVLRHRLDQEAAEDFLKNMESRTGWSASPLLASLKEQWDEDSDRG